MCVCVCHGFVNVPRTTDRNKQKNKASCLVYRENGSSVRSDGETCVVVVKIIIIKIIFVIRVKKTNIRVITSVCVCVCRRATVKKKTVGGVHCARARVLCMTRVCAVYVCVRARVCTCLRVCVRRVRRRNGLGARCDGSIVGGGGVRRAPPRPSRSRRPPRGSASVFRGGAGVPLPTNRIGRPEGGGHGVGAGARATVTDDDGYDGDGGGGVFGCGSGGGAGGGYGGRKGRRRRWRAGGRPCSCFDDAEFRARRPYPTPPSDVI